MRCPNCGSDNLSASGLCHKCGRPLAPSKGAARAQTARAATSVSKSTLRTTEAQGMSYVDHRDIPLRLKFEYSHTLKDQAQKALESLQAVLEHFTRPAIDVHALMQHVADIICKQFGIDSVAIGLKDPSDGKFKYSVLSGYREDAAQGLRKLEYARDDFYKDGRYNGTFISKYTKVFLAEDNEYAGAEKEAYNRPMLIGLKRRSLNDALEADYVDTMILGPNEELMGWIEISGTRTGKLPDAITIRWVEASAAIIGAALRCEKLGRGVA